MRATVSILGGISVLFVGFYGLSEAATQSKGAAYNSSNASASAWNTTTDVVGGLGQAAAPGVVWMGVAAIVLIAVGFLVAAGNSGR